MSATVTCPYCLHDETEPVDNEYGIYYCVFCDSHFIRPAPQQPAGVDRDGQGRPPAGGRCDAVWPAPFGGGAQGRFNPRSP